MHELTHVKSTEDFTFRKVPYTDRNIPNGITETPALDPRSLSQLRDALIATTVALADALVADGDRQRLETLEALYWDTARALAQRGWRVGR